jgi:cell wall-associated NlpC family hydrolase
VGKPEVAKSPAVGLSISERRENLAYYGLSLQGTRYRYAGRGLEGFDCSGFTSHVYKYFDMNLSPSSANQSTQGRLIPLRDTRPGDLVFFSHNGRSIGHVALVTRNEGSKLFVVHATNTRGVVEQDILTDKYWSRRIMFARNVIGD